MSEIEKRKLEVLLWQAADSLRSKVNADEYKNYILTLIFFKFLSEKQTEKAEDIFETYELKEDDSPESIEVFKLVNGYYIPVKSKFSELVKSGLSGENILNSLQNVLTDIESSTHESESEDDFKGLFSDFDVHSSKLSESATERSKIILEVMSKLDQIDFELSNVEADVIGDAYEYLISNFAASAGKKAGEFYTPQSVAQVLSKIVFSPSMRNIYDPTCGSGSLLLRAARELNKEDKANVMFYGQELGASTYNLARMNMILHDVAYDHFDIKRGDTLTNPKHIFDEHGKELKMDAIVANPPFSASWNPESEIDYAERFDNQGGRVGKDKADFAFIQHMYYMLSDNGTMAVVLPHGVLFRGGKELKVRQWLLDNNAIEAVIGLPSNIFFGTSIPTCILVLKKCKENKDVMFIDASNEFEKRKTQNFLTEDNVKKIISTYQQKTEIEKYSHLASIEEIISNDYNLNIPRYVDTFEEEEQIDLDEVVSKIIEIESNIKKTEQEILSFCNQLGIKPPFLVE